MTVDAELGPYEPSLDKQGATLHRRCATSGATVADIPSGDYSIEEALVIVREPDEKKKAATRITPALAGGAT